MSDFEKAIADKVRGLSPTEQEKVLRFIEGLHLKNGKPLRSPRGLWKDKFSDISEEDIAEARREMWGNFPREFP